MEKTPLLMAAGPKKNDDYNVSRLGYKTIVHCRTNWIKLCASRKTIFTNPYNIIDPCVTYKKKHFKHTFFFKSSTHQSFHGRTNSFGDACLAYHTKLPLPLKHYKSRLTTIIVGPDLKPNFKIRAIVKNRLHFVYACAYDSFKNYVGWACIPFGFSTSDIPICNILGLNYPFLTKNKLIRRRFLPSPFFKESVKNSQVLTNRKMEKIPNFLIGNLSFYKPNYVGWITLKSQNYIQLFGRTSKRWSTDAFW